MLHLSGSEGPTGAWQLCARLLVRGGRQTYLESIFAMRNWPCGTRNSCFSKHPEDLQEVLHSQEVPLGFDFQSCCLTQEVMGTFLSQPKYLCSQGDIEGGYISRTLIKVDSVVHLSSSAKWCSHSRSFLYFNFFFKKLKVLPKTPHPVTWNHCTSTMSRSSR